MDKDEYAVGIALCLPDVRLQGRLGFGQQSVVLIPPSFESSLKPYKTEKDQFELILFGFRGERTRTSDILLPKQAP